MSGDGVVRDAAAVRALPWLLFGVAAALRLAALDARPLHHDEGSNAIFVLTLLREGRYDYNPSNYHGPLFYYLTAAALRLFGASTTALRLAPALLGAALAPLAWMLRRPLGRPSAAAAGLLLAVSPSLVYYARDAIHESVLVFFTLLLVVAAVRGAAAEGRPGWWLVAGAAAGAVAATKETCFVVFGALFLALALTLAFAPGVRRPPVKSLAAFVLAAVFVGGAFYSQFFAEPSALVKPFQALRVWGARAVDAAGGHAKPWWYFLALLGREEPVLLLGGGAGAVVALRARDRLAVFAAAWAALTLVAYSCVAYKTPWLVINVTLPLALLSGVAFGAAWRSGWRRGARRGALAALVLAAGASAVRAVRVAVLHPEDDRASRLVYVQTDRDAERLVARLETLARAHPLGRGLRIEILSPDYLPLNWYLRDFANVAYYGTPVAAPAGDAVIARADQADAVAARLGPGYVAEDYQLRPGVRLRLYFRQAAR